MTEGRGGQEQSIEDGFRLGLGDNLSEPLLRQAKVRELACVLCSSTRIVLVTASGLTYNDIRLMRNVIERY
jgi:hypothetical protein